MIQNSSGRASHRPLAFQRTPPQLVDAESFLNEGRGRRLFPDKYQSHIHFGDGSHTDPHVTTSGFAQARTASQARQARRQGGSMRDADAVDEVHREREKPSRRPRGPGTSYARYIEEHGFPQDAARRHYGDDVAARERLRPFYTVRHDEGTHSAVRTAKRVHNIPFGRDGADALEPLNLFDRQENLHWLVGSAAAETARTTPDTTARCQDKVLSAASHAHRVEEVSVVDAMAAQARRVADLQRLLERETQKLLAMTQEASCTEPEGGEEDAMDVMDAMDAMDASHTVSTVSSVAVRRGRQPQPWELASGVEATVEADEGADDEDGTSYPVRAAREYTVDQQRRPPPPQPLRRAPTSQQPQSPSHIRVLARSAPALPPTFASFSSSPSSSSSSSSSSRVSLSSASEEPRAVPLPPRRDDAIHEDSTAPAATRTDTVRAAAHAPASTHWKVQLLAKAREREAHGFFDGPRWAPSHAPFESTVRSTPPAWHVPFPSSAWEDVRRDRSRLTVRAKAAVPSPPQPPSPHSGRATMQDRSRSHSRGHSYVADSPGTQIPPPRGSSMHTTTRVPSVAHSLLDVLTAEAPGGGRGGRGGRAAQSVSRVESHGSLLSAHNESVQSLRDVFDAADGARLRRRL